MENQNIDKKNIQVDEKKITIGVRGVILDEETKNGIRIIKDIEVLGFDVISM